MLSLSGKTPELERVLPSTWSLDQQHHRNWLEMQTQLEMPTLLKKLQGGDGTGALMSSAFQATLVCG